MLRFTSNEPNFKVKYEVPQNWSKAYLIMIIWNILAIIIYDLKTDPTKSGSFFMNLIVRILKCLSFLYVTYHTFLEYIIF